MISRTKIEFCLSYCFYYKCCHCEKSEIKVRSLIALWELKWTHLCSFKQILQVESWLKGGSLFLLKIILGNYYKLTENINATAILNLNIRTLVRLVYILLYCIVCPWQSFGSGDTEEVAFLTGGREDKVMF